MRLRNERMLRGIRAEVRGSSRYSWGVFEGFHKDRRYESVPWRCLDQELVMGKKVRRWVFQHQEFPLRKVPYSEETKV